MIARFSWQRPSESPFKANLLIQCGAVVPLGIGYLSDRFRLRVGIMLRYVAFGWVLSIGFWANPIVNNETVGSRAKAREQDKPAM
jgi:hypothetical protein